MEKRERGKKTLVLGTLLLGGAAALRSSYERRTLSLANYEVRNRRIEKKMRFAFLTDLHSNSLGRFNETLVRSIRDARPDVVLIGGDMMVTKPGKPKDFSALEDVLSGIYGLAPTYYAEGNHELRMKVEAERYRGWWDEFYALIESYDVKYLLDETVDLGGNVCLSGLEIEPDLYTKLLPKRMPEGYMHEHLMPSADRFHVVMAHTPQYMKNYWSEGADLVLSGHYHGGTVVLPGAGPLIAPDFRFFPRYARGMYTDDRTGSVGIVSAGLGTHSINVRLLNKPELVVVDLLPEEME